MNNVHTNLSLVFVMAPILLFALFASIPVEESTPKRERRWRPITRNNRTPGISRSIQGVRA